jgi:hypothetical protein
VVSSDPDDPSHAGSAAEGAFTIVPQYASGPRRPRRFARHTAIFSAESVGHRLRAVGGAWPFPRHGPGKRVLPSGVGSTRDVGRCTIHRSRSRARTRTATEELEQALGTRPRLVSAMWPTRVFTRPRYPNGRHVMARPRTVPGQRAGRARILYTRVYQRTHSRQYKDCSAGGADAELAR